MNSEKAMDLAATILIAMVGLLVAWVTFGVLESSADGEAAGYQVGGAIAGFLVTVLTLGSLYAQQRQWSGELAGLRDRNRELEQKLMRSATPPDDFEVEVDERQRVVLARPRTWEPHGGVLFDFQLSAAANDPRDVFPAQFVLSYTPIAEDPPDPEGFYAWAQRETEEAARNGVIGSATHEVVFLGDAPARIRCLKSTWCEYGEATRKDDVLTGKPGFNWVDIGLHAYEERLAEARAAAEAGPPPALQPAAPTQDGGFAVEAEVPVMTTATDPENRLVEPDAAWLVTVQRSCVRCYHEQLRTIFFFNFWDDLDDFPSSSAAFNRVLDSVRFLT